MKYNQFKQKIKLFPIFSSGLFSSITDNIAVLKVQITKWKKRGSIIQLKRGLYVLGDEDRVIEPSAFYLANQIVIPSYISLESALSYYGLIPEYVPWITSITTRKTMKFKNRFGVFLYQHIKIEGFTGFIRMKDQNKFNVLIASKEKAVVDFIYLNLNKINPKNKNIFKESYRFQNGYELSVKKLRQYSNLLSSKKLNIVIENFIEEIVK